MKKLILSIALAMLTFTASLTANYPNYENGYANGTCYPCGDECAPSPCAADCDPCAPCAPCAPACGTYCGLTICAVGLVIAGIVAAAAIVLTSGDGASTSHIAN